jgi:hypothetical protein
MKRRLFDKLTFLFVSLLTIVILSPFLLHSKLGQSLIYILFMVACVSTLYGLKLSRRALAITLIFGILSAATGEVSLLSKNTTIDAVSMLFTILFFCFLIALLVRYIVRAERVTGDILYGSVCVYLLIGIVFGTIYRFLDALNPNAFFLAGSTAEAAGAGQGDFTYYSFVTLTTLGYGDIQPVSAYARTAAFIEAVTGTLYVAILISRLVSLYITDSVLSKHK